MTPWEEIQAAYPGMQFKAVTIYGKKVGCGPYYVLSNESADTIFSAVLDHAKRQFPSEDFTDATSMILPVPYEKVPEDMRDSMIQENLERYREWESQKSQETSEEPISAS